MVISAQEAEAGKYLGLLQTQVLLNSVLGVTYLPEAILPQDGTQGMMAPPPIIIPPAAMVAATAALDALPNPARHEATFRYRLPEGTESARIVVTDIYGRMVADLKVEDGNGNLGNFKA